MSLSCLFFLVVFRDRPTHAPSAVALATEQHPGLCAGLKEICKNKSLLRLTIAYSLYIGFMMSKGTLISAIFSPFGYDPFLISMLGIIMLVSGVLGAVVFGIILDRTQAYKRLLQVMMLSAAIAQGLILYNMISGGPDALLCFLIGVLGFTRFPILPTSLGLGVELTFPMEPALVTGAMRVCARISAVVQVLIYSAALDVDPAQFNTAEELNETRIWRVKMCLGPWFFTFAVAMALTLGIT